MAMLGRYAFRMELHAVYRIFPMRYAHDDAIRRLGGQLQAIGHAVALDDQRVIARCREGIGHLREHAAALVADFADLAVHRRGCARDTTAECLTDRLMAKANTKRSEEHTSELQSLMRISYAVFCLKTNINVLT